MRLCNKQTRINPKGEITSVSRINVLVATTSPDMKAEIIATSVAEHPDMNLVTSPCISVKELDAAFKFIGTSTRCALVLVGHSSETNEIAQHWLTKRDNLVVLIVDVIDDIVRIGLRDPRLESLLMVLRDLVERVGVQSSERVAHVQLAVIESKSEPATGLLHAFPHRPLLQSAIEWIHTLLGDAVGRVSDENGDVHGFSVTRATLLQSLDASKAQSSDNDTDTALDRALETAKTMGDPLAVAANVFSLTQLEFRVLLLALAPELDVRYQRCMGFLLDEMSRRVGTLGLYCSLLGDPVRVRSELANTGTFSRWPIFEAYGGHHATADEPLRLDPLLVQWLLGENTALSNDPKVRRMLRLSPWGGVDLLKRNEENAKATELINRIRGSDGPQWLVLAGDDPAGWRALLELGGRVKDMALIRVESSRLAGLDVIEIEESARRMGRMAWLTGDPLVIDITKGEASEGDIHLFLTALDRLGCRAAVICRAGSHVVRLLGPVAYELVDEQPLPKAACVAAVRVAALGTGASVTPELAESIVHKYTLTVDALENAMRLARTGRKYLDAEDPFVERFTAACKELVSEGVSQLAERIEPVFQLDDVILPPDRKEQLVEIVDHVRLAPRVLDEWKFREQLPYGRGVTALFFGPSGAGKTMAALGVARRLGIQILRLDLSRVVSKYIGDTEKNIDRVFTDAQRSGSAILIDEADALFGKRSEVKDAHDRYANIEVSYLLQRMEAFEGLAILTTNMRQNLDPAFLRRLRFIVDFPRPDVPAREKIWRQCVPVEAHRLDDATFHQLARRIDLTGGHIRQITVRAAFIAAAADTKISLDHIAQAARAEFSKLGMPPVQLDIPSSRRAA